jgi:sporulation protein YlmC with PRC-barrel domain
MRTRNLTALLCATSILFPAAALGQQGNQAEAGAAPCDVLVNYLEGARNSDFDFPVSLSEAQSLQRAQDQQECRSSIREINSAVREARQGSGQQDRQASTQDTGTADGADIVVQQQPPEITIDQTAPEVTVRQSQPEVAVIQGQPEILVHQPAPTVTVDIPQPQITVRMPEPDINVSQAQPEVQVRQPRPEVSVTRSGQPQIAFEEQQARVTVERQDERANVQVERTGEPTIRYEREEAQVRVHQAEGQPEVRVERMQGGEQTQAQRSASRADEQPEQRASAQHPAEDRTGTLRVSQLIDADVVNRQDEEIGTVERVMVNPQTGETEVIVSLNGSVGEEGRLIALSVDQLQLRGDRIVVSGLSDQQIDQAPEWSERQGFLDANADDSAQLRRGDSS